MKKYLCAVMLIIFATLPYKIEAAVCDQAAFKKAESDAYKLQFVWEMKTDYNKDTTTEYAYYEFTVTGLTKEIVVITEDGYVTYGHNPDNPTVATYRLTYDGNGAFTYYQTIKASLESPCVGSIVYNKKISLSAYNIYYNKEECIMHPDFKYCAKNYNGPEPTEEQFQEELEKYVNELKQEKEEEEEIKKNKSFFEKTIDFIKEYKALSIVLATLLIIGIVIPVTMSIRKRKKRVKINLKR